MVKKRPIALRFEVWLAALDPTQGSEIAKTRPVAIVSPNEYNRHLNTVTIVPLTSSIKPFNSRVLIRFQDKEGQLAIDQIRSIDRLRLLAKIGDLPSEDSNNLIEVLLEYLG